MTNNKGKESSSKSALSCEGVNNNINKRNDTNNTDGEEEEVETMIMVILVHIRFTLTVWFTLLDNLVHEDVNQCVNQVNQKFQKMVNQTVNVNRM